MTLNELVPTKPRIICSEDPLMILDLVVSAILMKLLNDKKHCMQKKEQVEPTYTLTDNRMGESISYVEIQDFVT